MANPPRFVGQWHSLSLKVVMKTPRELVDLFLPHLAAGVDGTKAPRAALESVLRDLCARGRADWPDLDVPPERFLLYVGARLRAGHDLEAQLGALAAGDLYLACACAEGDVAAQEAFDRHLLPRVDASVLRVCRDASALDEIKANVRERILLGRSGKSPRLAEYAGRGPLLRWLRVVCVREALAIARKHPREQLLGEEELIGAPAAKSDPELSYLKRRYAGEFREIFRVALASLSAEERRLLRHRYLDDLQLDEIAPLFGVHLSTISRRLDKARARLLSLVRQAFRDQLGLAPREVASLLGLVASRLDLSIQRWLDPSTD